MQEIIRAQSLIEYAREWPRGEIFLHKETLTNLGPIDAEAFMAALREEAKTSSAEMVLETWEDDLDEGIVVQWRPRAEEGTAVG